MDILALGIFGIRKLGLNLKGMGSKVIALRLEKIGGEVLRTIAVEPRKSCTESRSRNAENSGLGDDISPARLRLVNGFVEEIVEKQVLEVGVLAIGGCDVFQEDRADDAPSAPHESDRWLVEFPFVFLSSLDRDISTVKNESGEFDIPLAST